MLEKCLEARGNFCRDCTITILISPFGIECIQDNFFRIEDKTICCEDLNKPALQNVIGGYMYAVFTEAVHFRGLSTLEMYYVDCWQSAYVDAGWKSLRAMLVQEAKNDFCRGGVHGNIVVSESFAPGFNGMPAESLKDLFRLMNLSEYGMELHDDSLIIPQKSITGIYLAGISPIV